MYHVGSTARRGTVQSRKHACFADGRYGSIKKARVFRRWPIWIPIAVYALTFVATFTIPTGTYRSAWFIAFFFWIFVLGPCITFYAVVNIALAYARPTLRKLIAEEYGQPRCWDCGYDLTDNVSGVCPECGTPLAIPPRGRGA
jgi:hypothetical protein